MPAITRRSDVLAPTLRRKQTDVERTRWHALRNRQLSGAKFRRQVPIGRYIVDFLCLEAMLIVELDGGQHTHEANKSRQDWLERQGYQVLRFWNNEIVDNLNGVLELIVGALSRLERKK